MTVDGLGFEQPSRRCVQMGRKRCYRDEIIPAEIMQSPKRAPGENRRTTLHLRKLVIAGREEGSIDV